MEPDHNTAKRIRDASDDDLNIHTIYHTGTGEENIEYHLVIAQKEYEGNEMLKVRYFALHPKTPEEDTWMKNGINIRGADEFIDRFTIDFNAIAEGLTGRGGEVITNDLSDEV